MMPCALIINTLTDVLFVLLFELFCISFNNFSNSIQFVFGKTDILCKLDIRFKPKLHLIPLMENMNTHSLFFIREDFEDITTFTTKNRTHYSRF